jgi:hypothetical protein
MWKRVALVFGPIFGVILLLVVLRPFIEAEDGPRETSKTIEVVVPPVPPIPPIPPIPEAPEIPDIPTLPDFSGAIGDHEVVLVAGQGKTVEKTCPEGAKVAVTGRDNVVTLVGDCGAVAVVGESNVIAATRAERLLVAGNANEVKVGAVRRIDVKGNDNEIGYEEALEGDEPEIEVKGRDNEITRVDPSS